MKMLAAKATGYAMIKKVKIKILYDFYICGGVYFVWLISIIHKHECCVHNVPVLNLVELKILRSVRAK